MNIKELIIAKIIENLSPRFRVMDNTGENKKVIAGVFPDVILMRPEPPPNSDILFVMKIEDGENMVDNVAEWKALGNTQSVFYILVPESKLDDAKKLVSATNVRARFGAYTILNDKVSKIRYE